MERSRNKEQVYKSMQEFEKKFFPESFRKQSIEAITDARAIGTHLAEETLDIIRRQLSKQTTNT